MQSQSQEAATSHVIATKTAEKPSEAILLGIEKFMADTMPVVQKSVTTAENDEEGRNRAVTLIKRLMGEVVRWLTFEEAVSVAEKFFSECQTKSGANHNISLSHQLLQLQEDFHAERKVINGKINELEYERDVTNREIATVITNFKGF